MIKELDSFDWEQAFGEGANYAEIKPQAVLTSRGKVSLEKVTRENVAEVVAMSDGEDDERDWMGVFRLADGRYISVCSGCDYTGWDCQSGGDVEVARSLDEILRYGVTEKMRERLGLREAGK